MNPKTPLVIWGAGGHASVVADVVRSSGAATIAGFLDDMNPRRHGTAFCGVRILGGHEQFEILRRDGVAHILVAIGDNSLRARVAEMAQAAGFALFTAVHPRAVVASEAGLGAGSVVMAGAVINPGARVGRNVIVNTGATVDHDCVLEDDVHISPGAHLAGAVRVGRATWIGIGAAVIQGLRIGERVVVGAGAVVVKDLPDAVVAYGNPARVVRSR